jgi:uncharacterized SAM-binding protein YcdF (DUF218 family)
MLLFAPVRWALRIFLLIVLAIVVYFVVTLAQVWLTSQEYEPHPATAIVVMGAAQYNGVPSPDLAARLNEALLLYKDSYANLIMVTGNKEKGDVYTESEASDRYLISKGVPADDILQAGGDDSYQNLNEAAPILRDHHVTTILMTSDPFHEFRSMAIATSMGFSPSPTPTQTSPIKGWSTVPYFLKEAVGVGLGRIIGFNHLEWLHDA